MGGTDLINVFFDSFATSSLANGLINSLVPIIAIIATSALGIIGLINGNKNFNKNSFNDIVSKNRVEWMQKLKSLVSEYSSKIAYNELRQIPKNEATLYDDIINTSTAIKLHLNFKGKADKEILDLIEKTNSEFEKMLLFKKGLNNKEIYSVQRLMNCCLNGKTKQLEREILCVFEKAKSKPIPQDFDMEKELINLLIDDGDYGLKVMISEKINTFLNKELLLMIKTLKNSEKLLIILVQIYLKVEWERVKFEARNDKKEKFDFETQYKEYKNYYSKEIIDICEKSEFDFIDITDLKR